MAIPPGGRGTFGDWLWSQRVKRFETQKDALAAYRKLAGLSISESEYAQWESGSRSPKIDNPKRLALYRFYGSEPEVAAAPVEVPQGADLSAVVLALQAQTAAIEKLTRAIEDQQDERLASSQAQALFLGVLARVLSPQGTDIAAAIQSAGADLDALRSASSGRE